MNHTQSGISLSELLIALFLSSLISTGLLQQYQSIKKHYQLQQQKIEDDLEVQMIVDFMRERIQQAGFTPCMSLNQLERINEIQPEEGIEAIQILSEPNNILRIQSMSNHFFQIEAFLNEGLLVLGKRGWEKGEFILLADCFHAEVHEIARVNRTTGGSILSLTKPLQFDYEFPVYIGRLLQDDFYVKRRSQVTSLFYKRKRADELSTLIRSMVVTTDQTVAQQRVDITLGLKNDAIKTIKATVRS